VIVSLLITGALLLTGDIFTKIHAGSLTFPVPSVALISKESNAIV